MRLLSAPFALPSLALAALVALNHAAGLRRVGMWTLLGCAVLLGTHAAGLFTRRRASWIFALALLSTLAADFLRVGLRIMAGGTIWKGAAG